MPRSKLRPWRAVWKPGVRKLQEPQVKTIPGDQRGSGHIGVLRVSTPRNATFGPSRITLVCNANVVRTDGPVVSRNNSEIVGVGSPVI